MLTDVECKIVCEIVMKILQDPLIINATILYRRYNHSMYASIMLVQYRVKIIEADNFYWRIDEELHAPQNIHQHGSGHHCAFNRFCVISNSTKKTAEIQCVRRLIQLMVCWKHMKKNPSKWVTHDDFICNEFHFNEDEFVFFIVFWFSFIKNHFFYDISICDPIDSNDWRPIWNRTSNQKQNKKPR